MRQVAALVSIIGLAVGVAFALRPSAGETAARAGHLTISVPRGFHDYAIRGGMYRTGTRAPVIGHMLTDFRLPADTTPWQMQDRWAALHGNGPPRNRVALILEENWVIGPIADKLHLPLTLGQPWSHETFANRPAGYRWGGVRFSNLDYEVVYWSGPSAPASDRKAVLEALRSIRPARK
jgi:hypothetical protein